MIMKNENMTAFGKKKKCGPQVKIKLYEKCPLFFLIGCSELSQPKLMRKHAYFTFWQIRMNSEHYTQDHVNLHKFSKTQNTIFQICVDCLTQGPQYLFLEGHCPAKLSSNTN